MINPAIFKAYDIRGIYPKEIDEEVTYKIVQAYGKFLGFPKKVALGRDVRLSSPSLWQAAANGLTDAGIDIYDIGVGTTDMYYFAVANYNLDGGLMVSASHNEREWNGLKMVRKGSVPISSDTGIEDIKSITLSDFSFKVPQKGKIIKLDIFSDYINKNLSFIDYKNIKKFKIVVNPNFGMAGKIIEELSKIIPMNLVKLNFEPDGSFPKGRPDPLIPENRQETSELIKKEKADFGVSWDADGDRCFFFDEKGRFIEGCYISAVLAKIILSRSPKGSKIISDPRLICAVSEAVSEVGGKLTLSKVGHSFIKEKMRAEDAVFGGENSAHYYFKDFFYCDNGIIPFLLILEYLSVNKIKLSEINDYYLGKFPVSGEINFEVANKDKVLKRVEEKYQDGEISKLDGLTVGFKDWRFNLRPSNTEPLIRLNIEAKTKDLVEKKKKELLNLIQK